MSVHFRKHILYYTLLITFLLLGITLILQTSYDKAFQIVLVVFTAFVYIVFGMLHHYFEHDLTPKIVIEYVLMSALGMTIVLLLIN